MSVDPVSVRSTPEALPDWVARPLLHAFLRPPRRPPVGNPRVSLGCGFTNLELTTSDGIRLSGWHVPHPNPRVAVVLAHGYSSCRETMLPYLRMLRPWGASAFAFDFRRHGLSGGRATTLGHREPMDLAAVVGLARAQHPGLPLLLVGESMGAAVSLRLAAADPAVDAVLADCPFATLDEPLANRLRLTFGESLGERLVPAAQRESARVLGVSPSEIGPASTAAGLDGRPVLLVHGEADRLIPASHSRLLCEMAGTRAELWTVPGAAHARCVRVAEDAYRRRLDTWIGSWLGGKAEEMDG